jgi:hypothetical protein
MARAFITDKLVSFKLFIAGSERQPAFFQNQTPRIFNNDVCLGFHSSFGFCI